MNLQQQVECFITTYCITGYRELSAESAAPLGSLFICEHKRKAVRSHRSQPAAAHSVRDELLETNRTADREQRHRMTINQPEGS